MTPQELKNSILQLAIQGKLVEQRADEGTGAELLEKILAAKNAEGAKGKGMKLTRRRGVCEENKTSALSASPREEIPDDEKPFDIPESWEWVRLGEIGTLTRGSGIKRTETCECGFPCVRYGELYTTYKTRFSVTKSFVSRSLYNNSKKICNGDVVMTLTGENKTDIAIAVVYEGQDEIAMGGDMTCWSHHGMESLYLVYLMNSPYAISCKRELATGDIIVHISNEKLSSIWLPLPPLAEQKRIVAKIEELMPLVDRYEKAWSRLEDFNKRFPADMQKSLLQLAIQGKLVEQKADEGTGAELLEKILAAKNAEGAKGKGEKSHAKSAKSAKVGSRVSREEIPDDEKPFDIPESWEWVRLGEIVNIVSARRVHQSDWQKKGIPFYRAREIAKLSVDGYVDNDLFISLELYNDFARSGVPKEGDLMVTAVGTLGKTYIVKASDRFYYKDASVICFENYAHIFPQYLKCLMDSELMKNQIKSNSSGTTVATLTMVRAREYLIPLPPLAEQKRIVAKLEELLPLCERLKSESNSAANS